jgi:hypothetical protein
MLYHDAECCWIYTHLGHKSAPREWEIMQLFSFVVAQVRSAGE